jgi:hypothetical protein
MVDRLPEIPEHPGRCEGCGVRSRTAYCDRCAPPWGPGGTPLPAAWLEDKSRYGPSVSGRPTHRGDDARD